MSPSALSHAVAATEARLGVRLFHRTTRSVALTAAGEDLVARVKPAVKAIADAFEAVNAFRETPRGSLRISVAESAARLVYLPYIRPFLAQHPDVHVDLVIDNKLVDIVRDGYDAGVRTGDMVPRDMSAVSLGNDIRYVVAAAPTYFAKHGRPHNPEELSRHVGIRGRLASGGTYPWEFEKRGKPMRFEPHGPLTTGSHDVMLQAALAGDGLLWTADATLTEHLESGALETVLDDWSVGVPSLRLYYPGGKHVPATLRALVASIRATNGANATARSARRR